MSSNSTTVIDLGVSNIASVLRALDKLGLPHQVTTSPADAARAGRLILPGVGSFTEAAGRLRRTGMDEALKSAVIGRKAPILGICLGMQLFADYGTEGGGATGLGLVPGRVLPLRAGALGLRLPHIGWNDVRFEGFDLSESLPPSPCFYFVHGYELVPSEPAGVSCAFYGADFAAAVQRGNVYGVQFHPEKSQAAGLRLLENFCRTAPT